MATTALKLYRYRNCADLLPPGICWRAVLPEAQMAAWLQAGGAPQPYTFSCPNRWYGSGSAATPRSPEEGDYILLDSCGTTPRDDTPCALIAEIVAMPGTRRLLLAGRYFLPEGQSGNRYSSLT